MWHLGVSLRIVCTSCGLKLFSPDLRYLPVFFGIVNVKDSHNYGEDTRFRNDFFFNTAFKWLTAWTKRSLYCLDHWSLLDCNCEHLGILVSEFRRNTLIPFWRWKFFCAENGVSTSSQILTPIYQNRGRHLVGITLMTSLTSLLPFLSLLAFNNYWLFPYQKMSAFRLQKKFSWEVLRNLWYSHVPN